MKNIVLIGRDHSTLTPWELSTLQSFCGLDEMQVARHDNRDFGPESPDFAAYDPSVIVPPIETLELSDEIRRKIEGKRCIAVRVFGTTPAVLVCEQMGWNPSGYVMHVVE